jgi:flagellar motor switch protein FliG
VHSASKKSLTGPEKAAVLILAVGTTHASKVFDLLSGEDIKILADAISHLGMVRAELAHAVCARFMEEADGIVGTTRRAEIVLRNILGEKRTNAIMDELKTADDNAIWEKVSAVDGAVLSNYLRDEHPQTIAVVLSHIAPRRAAEVFSLLSQEVSCEVLRRVLKTENVQSDVLADVGKTLQTELLKPLPITERKNIHTNVAEIFNHMETKTSDTLFNYLAKHEKEDAVRIRSLMVTFENLIRIAPDCLSILAQHAGPTRIALALKVAPEQVRTFFHMHLSGEIASLIKEEVERKGVVRVGEINQAQSEIVTIAKRLLQQEQIHLSIPEQHEERMVV